MSMIWLLQATHACSLLHFGMPSLPMRSSRMSWHSRYRIQIALPQQCVSIFDFHHGARWILRSQTHHQKNIWKELARSVIICKNGISGNQTYSSFVCILEKLIVHKKHRLSFQEFRQPRNVSQNRISHLLEICFKERQKNFDTGIRIYL